MPSEVSNVKRTRFYVCEKCGNLLTSIGDADVVCCGRKLSPLSVKKADEAHKVNVKIIEDDYYITFSHSMTKEHYISFFSYVQFSFYMLKSEVKQRKCCLIRANKFLCTAGLVAEAKSRQKAWQLLAIPI